MKLKFKAIASLCSAMIFSAAIFGVIYSCSSDECDIINSSMEDVVVNKNPLMISVENSNEFLAFIKENESVMAKFLMYKETLSESDYNELMSNVNDDDYLLDIINKADMLNDLQRLGAKMNSLLANTQYERLNQMEEITRQMFQNLEDVIDSHWDRVTEECNYLKDANVQTTDELCRHMKKKYELSAYADHKITLMAVDSEGGYYTESGKRGLFRDLDYFEESPE